LKSYVSLLLYLMLISSIWAQTDSSIQQVQELPGNSFGGTVLKMSREQASSFARMALKGIQKEYPNKPEHVLNSEADILGPRALHPAFYGSFDWHSSVHNHWMLVRLLRLVPDMPESPQLRVVLSKHLTAKNLQTEADYFA